MAPTKLPRTYPLPIRKLHEKFRKEEHLALDKYNTATAFIRDGALSTGARILREAADHFEAAQIARNDALTLMSKHPVT